VYPGENASLDASAAGLDADCVRVRASHGGALRLVWKSQDADPVMSLLGVFSEVVTHQRMVHTELMLLGNGMPIGSQVETHEFEETNGTTALRITQVYISKEARDGALASGADQGMEAGFKQLDALLAQRP
jgi:uncharacterized protein YndB with AHSA1/START domain